MRLPCLLSCRVKGQLRVEEALRDGGACGAADWSEVAQKVRAHGRNWDLSRSLLISYGVQVEAVTAADAEWAARRWAPGEELSLADRLCLALGDRLDARHVDGGPSLGIQRADTTSPLTVNMPTAQGCQGTPGSARWRS